LRHWGRNEKRREEKRSSRRDAEELRKMRI